jgi:hypothetical protein
MATTWSATNWHVTLVNLLAPPAPDPVASMREELGELQLSPAETERNRVAARQIKRTEEMTHHRIRDDHMAPMIAFNGILIQELIYHPQSLPTALAPR